MTKAGRAPEGKKYTPKLIFGFLASWKTLLFTLIFALQPFVSLPSTAFVFWLKAHNKKGQPLVYTVAQIVSDNLSTDFRLIDHAAERTAYLRKRIRCCLLIDMRLDFRWPASRSSLACRLVQQRYGYHRFRAPSCDSCHGPIFSSGSAVHYFHNLSLDGSSNNGLDVGTDLGQCRAASLHCGTHEHTSM